MAQLAVPGGAFRYDFQFTDEGQKFRFFFVLNRNPQEDDILVLVTATTKITKARKRVRRRNLVAISPGDYDSLSTDSVVDCSSPLIYPKQKIVEAIKKKQVIFLPPLPTGVLQNLRTALLSATTVSPEIKRLVAGDEKEGDGN